MSAASAWPSALAGTPAIAVIERAIEKHRLSHSLLLQGEDSTALLAIARGMADRLLNVAESSAQFAAAKHPDCFLLQPSGKMRVISADTTRALISKLQVSAAVSPNKVAIIQDADRMNPAAANVFLKTLEEPPRNTTLILLSTRPYALLPTIRSRVQYFRFSSLPAIVQLPAWDQWLADYRSWLAGLCSGAPAKQPVSVPIMGLYGLVARFSPILEQLSASAWETEKLSLSQDIEDDVKTAIEAGLSNGLRSRLFADIERATLAFSLPLLNQANASVRRPLASTVDSLERSFGLLGLNLNESTALEDFMLGTLRHWARR
jgi:DNA polymerase-3 subunit delta'